MNEDLRKIITDAICQSGTDQYAFTLSQTDVLLDEEERKSVLISIQFNTYDVEGVKVIPEPVVIEFCQDKEDNTFQMIIGEDAEMDITFGNLYAIMYFHSLQPEPSVDHVLNLLNSLRGFLMQSHPEDYEESYHLIVNEVDELLSKTGKRTGIL